MPRRTLVVGLAMATTITGLTVPGAAAEQATVKFPSSDFPLGARPALTKTVTSVSPGIDLYDVQAGSSTDGYTVTVLMPNGRDAGKRRAAENVLAEVEAAGEVAGMQRLIRPQVADAPEQELFMVRVGLWPFEQRAKADKMARKLKQAGLKVKVDYLGDDGLKTTGPWHVKVLMVDARTFRGSYAASLGTSVAKRETVSSMARRDGAIAAVNGGFFNIRTARHWQGDPVGASVVGGRLLSEAVPGRSAIVLRGRTARITELETRITLISQDGAQAPVSGVNRAAAENELVLYTEEWGSKTPKVDGTDVVIDADGRVEAVRAPGAAVPKGKRVLHGSGEAGMWLNEHAWEGWKVTVDTKVRDLRKKRTLKLTPDLHIVSGGVGLVRNGQTKITAKRDGHDSLNMILRRHPRTLVGTTRNGSLILATVDGRKPGVTVGANFHEAAQLMRWLGATQAINLDGGGSTAMVVKNKVVNKPSDGRERAVGDALLVLPH